jgi:hypothetical protein
MDKNEVVFDYPWDVDDHREVRNIQFRFTPLQCDDQNNVVTAKARIYVPVGLWGVDSYGTVDQSPLVRG